MGKVIDMPSISRAKLIAKLKAYGREAIAKKVTNFTEEEWKEKSKGARDAMVLREKQLKLFSEEISKFVGDKLEEYGIIGATYALNLTATVWLDTLLSSLPEGYFDTKGKDSKAIEKTLLYSDTFDSLIKYLEEL